ncbi:hypothetical protein LY90DRAFT_276723 [Neocallimastix californiae]|uniref:Uncharacterized protein n=1 Tax=Neocallimastix californiae TaxID=1754190 RepID=A0A1Y2D783_9FUNG|nr:hypothetical protein LY90DRAFT_276723 [Neocallimastix californiae]|eukprot:ORY54445.1 hypothetical protein LY90DRAFT_276723 [Neocallimastix californiae]
MDEFLPFSKQNEDYTNNLSIVDNVIIEDVAKKLISEISNGSSSNELTDANGSINDDNRSLQFSLNNNNGNYNQINTSSDKNLHSFNNSYNNNNNNNNENNRNGENNMNEKGGNGNNGKSKIINKEIRKIRCSLRRAVVDCSERGLFQASKW